MSLPASVLDLVARIAVVVARHPWGSVLGALVLGLVAAPRVRRFAQRTIWVAVVVAKWTLIVARWAALVVYMLPARVVALALLLGASASSPATRVAATLVSCRCPSTDIPSRHAEPDGQAVSGMRL